MTERQSIKFELGIVAIHRHAHAVLTLDEVAKALSRHQSGDWGEVSDGDREENELSLVEGYRLLSVYRSAQGQAFWIITEADRSMTTVLLPEDY